MLLTISVVTFLVNGSAVALAPFLLDVSRDLGVTLGAAANLIALMSISWGVVSVTAGAASDRIGNRQPPRQTSRYSHLHERSLSRTGWIFFHAAPRPSVRVPAALSR